MLGIQQQTHSAAVHHPPTRSAVSAAASTSTAPLRTSPITKKRQSAVQKHHFTDTLSPTQDNKELHAEAGAEPGSAWSGVPRGEHGADQHQASGEGSKPDEGGSDQNKHKSDEASGNAQRASNETTEQEQREGEVDDKTDRVDDYTRHPSSPLSELSPAPDEDDNPNQEENGDSEESSEATAVATDGLNTNGQPLADELPDPANPVSLSAGGLAAVNSSQSNNHPSLAGNSTHQTTLNNPFGGEPHFIDGLLPSTPSHGTSSQLPAAIATPSTSSPGKASIENTQAGPSRHASTSPSKNTEVSKVSLLLELNAELLKVCQAFIAAGYSPQESPEARPFSKRLEENLHWMSAHVDGRLFAITGPPETDPPHLAPSAANIAFPEGIFVRINSLYSQVPVVFAKDIARKNQLFSSPSATGTPIRKTATPSLLPPSGIGVKRERPDSSGYQSHDSPTAAKRRDTGESKTITGPNTPVQPGFTGAADMPPPATPSFHSPSHSQIARPSSSAGRINPITTDVQGHAVTDGMFSPSSNPGMSMNNIQGVGNMGGLSPEAQARVRQMQMRQAQAIMMQQQQGQGQLHQQTNQQQQGLQQSGAQAGYATIGSPQRQSHATPSPTQQQMMQAQAAAARQMSPPGTAAGMGMGMGVNGTDGMVSSQQNLTSSNMSQTNANAGMTGMGTSANSNMTLNPQMVANMGPHAAAAYQILQNPQHAMTRYLNQQMPGFSQLPMMEQMRRFQVLQQQRQAQQNQRNQQIANQMMGGQMSPTNAAASGSGASQMQNLGQGGQMNMAPQIQASTSESGMQFPGTPVSANMPGRPATSMGMPQQMSGMAGMQGIPNMANLNPQQRQLYLMQMQMRNAGMGGTGLGANTGMNPPMMNPQLLQERQRLEQQQRLALAQRHSSPLNPAASAGQFPPGLRSNPNASVGIARTVRSPSVASIGDMAGAATPRIGGRMLPGSDDYQRQALLQQAQRNAQMQQQQGFMQGQAQVPGGWPGQQPQQLPLSAGAWPQQNQGFGMGTPPSNAGMQGVDFMSPSRQASATPAPSIGHHSPTAPASDFDNMMNW